jgi:hypothetical protein
MAYWDQAGGSHETYEDMHNADNANKASGHWAYQESGSSGSGGSGGGNAAIAMIIAVMVIIPAILAKIFSAIFAFFFKLWIVGKFLQTIIFGLFCTSVVISFFGVAMYLPYDAILLMAASIFIISGLWYWLFHYDEIKTISIKEFSNAFTISFAILFYGFFICNFIITGITSVLFGRIVERIVFNIVTLGIFIAAIIAYLKKTKEYRQEAASVRKHPKLKKTILTIAVVCLVVLTAAGTIGSLNGVEIFYEKTVNSKTASSSEVEVKVPMLKDAVFYAEPSENANVIRTIKKGETVIVMYDMEFKDKLLPVKYGRQIGWVNMDYVNWED